MRKDTELKPEPKCAAVTVTYFPDSNAIASLKQLSRYCDEVFVVDNTPDEAQSALPRLPNVTILKFGKNVGLGMALNEGIYLAGSNGLENIFLLDQDSRASAFFFRSMLDFHAKQNAIDENVAFCVPNFYDRNSLTYANFPVLSRFTVTHAQCNKFFTISRRHALIAITSGTLMTYSKFKKIGPFREDYFIDFLDNEYCLRSFAKGFRVAVNCGVVLNHAVGKRSTHRFCGLTLKPNNHLPVRRYYIARNGTKTAVDYFSDYPVFSMLLIARLIHELISIAGYENLKTPKIKALFYGLCHGLIGKMGICRIPSL